MESLETDLGPQARSNVGTLCDEDISAGESEQVVNKDQSVTDADIASHSKLLAEVEVIPVTVRSQDGPTDIQCSDLDLESRQTISLIPEIVDSIGSVTETSPVESRAPGENSDVILKTVSVSVDDICLISKSCETDCSDEHVLLREADGVISQDELQKDDGLSQKPVDESPILPSDLSVEVNNSFEDSDASSQDTIITFEETSIELQKANDFTQENSVSKQQEASVSPKSNSISSQESSLGLCISSQATSASLQVTSVFKQETELGANIVEEKVLSCGLDLVCDNDSEETSLGDQNNEQLTHLASIKPSFNQDTQVITKQKRKRMLEGASSIGDKVPIASSSKPEWLKPFEDGWCREVVLRKEVGTSGVRPADIYYYAPSGKKLRSMPEICQHLKENQYLLDTNCFTFTKCVIYQEPFETVRNAGGSGGRSAKSSPVQQSARAWKGSLNSSLSAVKKKLKMVVVSPSTGNVKKKGLRTFNKKRPMSVEDSQSNGTDAKRCKLVEKNFPQEVGPKLCGLKCVGSEGVPPNIPCDNCMCMFHSKCIQFSATSSSFTCQNCQIQQRTSRNAAFVPSSVPLGIPSLRPIILHSNAKQRPAITGVRGPPPLQRANVLSRPPPTFVITPTPVPPMILPMHLVRPFCVTTTTFQPLQLTAAPASGVYVRSLTTPDNLVQSSASLSQPTRQLRLVLPPNVVTQLNLEKPLALKINGQQLLLQPNEFIPIENGIKVLLPESLIAKSGLIVDTILKPVAGADRPDKSRTAAHDKGDICIIEPDSSQPPVVAAKSSVVTLPVTVPQSSQTLNGKLSQNLKVSSTAKQLLAGMVKNCQSLNAASSNVSSLGTGKETSVKTVEQTSSAQVPLLPEKTNPVAPNSDVSGSAVESRPVIIRVDSDTESDSEVPPIDVSKVVSSASVVLPPYVIAPESPTDAASVTSCQSVSSCVMSSVSLAVLDILSKALTAQPPLASCILSFATSTVPSTLPICDTNGGALDIPELSVAVPTSPVSSASVQTSEHLVSDTNANHSNDVAVSAAGRSDRLSETATAAINRVDNDVGSRRCAAFRRVWSNFGMLHAGFNAMLHIFRHLGVCDLLSAASVCKMWHKVAKDAELWRSIGFRGCRIKNWQQAAVHFQRTGTWRLDFRGMLQNFDGFCTWLDTAENRSCISTLQQVDFGQCSARVLSVAAEAFPNLQSVTAEIVTLNSADSGSTCPEFNPGKLTGLHELRCLRVRGLPGVTLPRNSGDANVLHNLGHLKQLQNLSLTTLRGVEGKDFNFIGSLSQLQVLELGNCLNWTKETFGNLAKLVNLTNLRLECGGDPFDAGLGDALKKLTNLQHLELIRYFVADNLAIVFPTLTHLRTFFIWPELQENEAQVGRQNSIILSAVSGMLFLKRLFWGITKDSQSAATDDGSSAVTHQASIPFLLRGSSSVDQRTLSTRRLTIKEIVSALSDHLPSTEIRVFQVPAQSHQINSQ